MAQHIPDRDQPVLHVVIDLSGQVAGCRAALHFAQPCRAQPEALGHGPEHAGQRADLVVPIAGERLIQPVEVDGGGALGERRERAADACRQPPRREQGQRRGQGEGRQEPAVEAVPQRDQRGGRLGDAKPSRVRGARPRRLEIHERQRELGDGAHVTAVRRDRGARIADLESEIAVARQVGAKPGFERRAAGQRVPGSRHPQ
jgi:hypothetical protein